MTALPKTGTAPYHLVEFDKDGAQTPTGKINAEAFFENLTDETTDIFIMSHGWMADHNGAVTQYDKWTEAMRKAKDSQKLPASFKSIVLGIHWPSKPYSIGTSGERIMGAGAQVHSGGSLVDEYASSLGDTPETRQSIATLLNLHQSIDDLFEPERLTGSAAVPPTNTPSAQEIIASEQLEQKLGIPLGGLQGLPLVLSEFASTLGKEFPQMVREISSNFGVWFLNLTSYYEMKKRAYIFGRNAAYQLLTQVREKAPGARIHLVGHSFGCIVVVGMLAGPTEQIAKIKVNSLVLLQGALSKWAFCSEIPGTESGKGEFHSVIANDQVAGPIVTTSSRKDLAVCVSYVLASKLRAPFEYPVGQLAAYQGLGDAGACGRGIPISEIRMLANDSHYKFREGIIYNVEGTEFICDGLPPSGAHCDIAKAAVANLVWQAALSTV